MVCCVTTLYLNCLKARVALSAYQLCWHHMCPCEQVQQCVHLLPLSVPLLTCASAHLQQALHFYENPKKKTPKYRFLLLLS